MLDWVANLVAQEQPVADAVRHGLLRHRADGDRRLAPRHRPLRLRGHALQPAAVRPDDRRRPRGHEDGAGACSASGCKCRSRNGASRWAPAPPSAASSTPTPWCRASTASSRWTCTCPAVRRGRSSCSSRSWTCRTRCRSTGTAHAARSSAERTPVRRARSRWGRRCRRPTLLVAPGRTYATATRLAGRRRGGRQAMTHEEILAKLARALRRRPLHDVGVPRQPPRPRRAGALVRRSGVPEGRLRLRHAGRAGGRRLPALPRRQGSLTASGTSWSTRRRARGCSSRRSSTTRSRRLPSCLSAVERGRLDGARGLRHVRHRSSTAIPTCAAS